MRLILVFIGLYCFISLIYSYNFCKEKSLKKNVFDKILTKKTFSIIAFLTFLYAIYLYLYAMHYILYIYIYVCRLRPAKQQK